MSTMLDAYDMQMTDYHADLDIQMHPSSSDQWFQDEAKMEEDVPALKLENFVLKPEGHLKTDLYPEEKIDGTIEVDMDLISDHQNVEYDMLEDEEVQDAGTDIDVEVYDASRGHSPGMGSIDLSQGQKSIFLDIFESAETNDTLNQDLPPEPLDPGEEQGDLHELESENVESVLPAEEAESVLFTLIAESKPLEASTSQQSNLQIETPSDHHQDEECHTIDTKVLLPQAPTTELVESGDADSLEVITVHTHKETSQDKPDEKQPQTQLESTDNSLGDPHEISEGVYIDPPPPVLLSLSPGEHFTFALFNKPAEWNSSLNSSPIDHLLLHQLPTLYYEPLSSVFEALRHEAVIGSTFRLAEGELVLDAVDLQLSISEDNIYAREVALHDLNVLHDISGVSGLLRIRLYTSTPRFIVRYQQLQAQVSQPNLEPPPGEVSDDGVGVTELSGEENIEEKEQEIIQRPHEAEDQRWKPLEPLSSTGWSTNESSYDEEEHNDRRAEINHEEEHNDGHAEINHDEEPNDGRAEINHEEEHNDRHAEINHEEEPNDARAEISHEEEATSDTHEGAQNHENPSEGAEEVLNQAVGEIGEEDPQESLEESYDEVYHEGYEVNPDDSHTSEVLSALPDVPQTMAENHNISRLSEQGSHEASPDLEDNVISLELLEADSTDDGSIEQVSNESYQVTTGPQLTKIVGEDLNEGDFHEQNIAHSEGAIIKLSESSAIASVANRLEQPPSHAESENIEEIATPQPTLGDPSAIHGILNPPSIGLGPDDYSLNIESSEDLTIYGDVWQDDPDGAGDFNATWDDENDNALSNSNHSSATLSSKASKRSFDEFESGGEGYDDEEGGNLSPSSSPDPKRSRTE